MSYPATSFFRRRSHISPPSPLPPEPPFAHTLRGIGEFLLLTLVALSPWAFGCTEPYYTYLLFAGLGLLSLVWAAHAVTARRFAYRSDAVSACLVGLVLLGALQLVPLPLGVVRVVSPTAAEWHVGLRPEVSEALPGEVPVPRPGWARY